MCYVDSPLKEIAKKSLKTEIKKKTLEMTGIEPQP